MYSAGVWGALCEVWMVYTVQECGVCCVRCGWCVVRVGV